MLSKFLGVNIVQVNLLCSLATAENDFQGQRFNSIREHIYRTIQLETSHLDFISISRHHYENSTKLWIKQVPLEPELTSTQQSCQLIGNQLLSATTESYEQNYYHRIIRYIFSPACYRSILYYNGPVLSYRNSIDPTEGMRNILSIELFWKNNNNTRVKSKYDWLRKSMIFASIE